ncbi:MAG: hypothetical protein KDD50_07325 [Bdellovibrionales bacterium]|nr:hypothetical protein [Bdellovibrionales bacterium]
MDIPVWLSKYLSREDTELIEGAVERAEKLTMGEIVPMVVKSSSTTNHVFLSLAFFMLSLYLLLFLFFVEERGAFFQGGVFIAFVLLLFFLEKKLWVQRILTPARDRAFQVEQRAVKEFYQHRVNRTEKSTGILIFVSLFEHQVVVLGDRAISSKIPKAEWDGLVKVLVQGIKKRRMGQGFVEAIQICGGLLEAHFPKEDTNPNELSNHLVIKT